MLNYISQKELEKIINFRNHMRKEWYRAPIKTHGEKRDTMQFLAKEWSCIQTLKECSKSYGNISHPPIHRHDHLSSDGIISGINEFFQCLLWLSLFYFQREMFFGSIFKNLLIFHGNFQFSLEQQKTIGEIGWFQSSERRIRIGV